MCDMSNERRDENNRPHINEKSNFGSIVSRIQKDSF